MHDSHLGSTASPTQARLTDPVEQLCRLALIDHRMHYEWYRVQCVPGGSERRDELAHGGLGQRAHELLDGRAVLERDHRRQRPDLRLP
jgi:hypothetical protein